MTVYCWWLKTVYCSGGEVLSVCSVGVVIFQTVWCHFVTDAYILEPNIARFGTSHRDAVIGEVYCVGNEPELLECSHGSIGSHRCDVYPDYNITNTDIIISCYGIIMCMCISGQYTFVHICYR